MTAVAGPPTSEVELIRSRVDAVDQALDQLRRVLDDPAAVLAKVRQQWDACDQIIAEAKADLRPRPQRPRLHVVQGGVS